MPNWDKPGVVGLASAYDAGTLVASHAHTAHQIVHSILVTMRVSVQNKIWFAPPGRVREKLSAALLQWTKEEARSIDFLPA
jgi:hypothetical protein